MIRLANIHKAFGDNSVLRGVDLQVHEGTTAVVMGGSGSGKSVLLKTIVQLLRPDEGEVWVDGTRADLLSGDELDALRLSFGYLFQGGALFDSTGSYDIVWQLAIVLAVFAAVVHWPIEDAGPGVDERAALEATMGSDG